MKRALVLSGGGSKGAFEVGAIANLVNKKKLDFQLLTGTSVGALNAAFLGQARNHQELQELAEELTGLWLGIKGNRCIYRGGLFGSLWRFASRGALYNPRGLRDLIHRRIDSERLFHPRTVVKVTVVSFETGKLLCADSRCRELQPDYLAYVLASASMPFFFPAVPIAGQHWYDGGLRDLTPLAAAIKEHPDEIIVITTFPSAPIWKQPCPPPGPAMPSRQSSGQWRSCSARSRSMICNSLRKSIRLGGAIRANGRFRSRLSPQPSRYQATRSLLIRDRSGRICTPVTKRQKSPVSWR